ncbi:MAG: 4-hydroxythreonine-4-phosphate dehydrogenase PdxA [Muribaculum sp.]|nr:4-hydroxythreonine-4-phosphate dehydrogenase PdxA [Muribaculum sp.]
MSSKKIKVGITLGDINGIGPEVVLKALSDSRMAELCTPVIYGPVKVAEYFRKQLELPDLTIGTVTSASEAADGHVSIVDVADGDVLAVLASGTPTPDAGLLAFKALERAVADLKAGDVDVLVTAPICKDTIQSDTFHFPGHTEYLESVLAEDNEHALMTMCTSDGLRVALVTAHTPLNRISDQITKDAIIEKLRIFNASLKRDFCIEAPRIAVLSLNPHAGENGLLGTEESEVIVPAIEAAQQEKILAFGPYAADGFFGSDMYSRFDGVLAMYHDQGLAPFKTLAMDSGVNFTAGLGYVRTSPDHGTGYDIAGRGIASPDSMRQAIYMAIDVWRNRHFNDVSYANPLKSQMKERPERRSHGPRREPDVTDISTDQSNITE